MRLTSFPILLAQCFELDDGRRYLRADFSIDCDGSAHTALTPFAILMVLIYPIGVPLMYWLIFWSFRDQIKHLQGVELLQARLKQAAEAEEFHEHHEGHGSSEDPLAEATVANIRKAKVDRRLEILASEQEEALGQLPGYLHKLLDGYEMRTYGGCVVVLAACAACVV